MDRSKVSCWLCGVLLGLLFCRNTFSQDLLTPISDGLGLKPTPMGIVVPQFGQIDFHALATGIGMAQTNPVIGDFNSLLDISNAQVIIQKESGLLQFYVQAGYYSTPSLGTTYQRASQQTKDSFGVVPLASVSIAPSDSWIFSAGKINSFGGYENTFTYQNINIDRGLLWNQTSNVSKGFQASYKSGNLATAITVNDGFYSNQLSWMGASASYQLSKNHNMSLTWAGSIKANSTNSFITPVAQNNSQIANAIYTYLSSRWSITPYLQYTYVPMNPSIGILASAQTSGVAVLMNYRLTGDKASGVTLPARFEYINSAGKGNASSPNLLYGAGSAAWSATITPTYQQERLLVRVELSYVQTINSGFGQAFGQSGNAKNQTRAMIETGILY